MSDRQASHNVRSYRLRLRSSLTGLLVLILLGMPGWRPLLAQTDPIDFNLQIRPILSDHCYACHGPDENHREGGFRLDQKDSAFGEADSGELVIVAGDVDTSELIARITSHDSSLIMPPEETNKPLKPEQIELLKQWIAEGANWEEHWSFVAPSLPEVPAVMDSDWASNEIDAFVLAKLEREGLRPSAMASKTELLRRVTFDLTGLPPTLDELNAFLADDSPDAYEKVVDRLLKSPRYGEHMARFWLDAARYGDTHGLHLDNYREMWLYRDWVVNAFNNNKPYDVFAIEQLAGDLLPDPSEDQLIATGFNRCHVTTNEGGSIVEEVMTRNVVDRVVTTGTVYMGLTLDCTRCHDHKYDPLTMEDFYSMYAFFNSMDGSPMDGNVKDPAPVLKVLSDEQKSQLEQLKLAGEQLRQRIRDELAQINYQEPSTPVEPQSPEPETFVWIEDAIPEGASGQGGWQFVEAPQPVFSGTKSSTRTADGLSQHFIQNAPQPLKVGEGDVLFAHVYLDPENPPKEIMLQFNDGSWDHRAYWGENLIDWGNEGTVSRLRKGNLPETGKWVRLEVTAAEVGLAPGAMISGWAFTQFDGTTYWDQAGIVSLHKQNPAYESFAQWLSDQRVAQGAGLPEALKTIVNKPADQQNEEERTQLLQHFLEHVFVKTREVFAPLHEQLAANEKQQSDLNNAAATTLIFREKSQPVAAHILNRGEYDQPGNEVQRRTPQVFGSLPDDAPKNRLGLAQWLVSPENPLTARVAVNRFWQQAFGVGLVKTSEDFGSQGSPPSHPKLLDWLAVRFQQDGWDIKQFMKRMVMSSTYRQSSVVRPELRQRDPENRLLARGPRYRLDAEMLRDQALFLSGLMVEEVGGPSVKPPQPDGLWFAVGYSGSNTVRFKADSGPNKVHRRTLYTFIKRTSPPPQLSTFDAPSREACVMRRERTNTPLQALLLLNDPQYFEAARVLGQRAIATGGDTPQDRAAWLLTTGTCRLPRESEVQELIQVYEAELARFNADIEAAQQVVSVGEAAVPTEMNVAEIAAWTIVANLVLNLDEVVTKN